MKKIKIKLLNKKIPSRIIFIILAVLIILSGGIILDNYYQDKIWAGVFVGDQSLNEEKTKTANEKVVADGSQKSQGDEKPKGIGGKRPRKIISKVSKTPENK